MVTYFRRIDSKAENITPLITELEEKWLACGVDDKTAFGLRLALEELLTNAIKHGNKGNPDLKATVDCAILPGAIEISVSDEGLGFDHCSMPDPTEKENLEKQGGRGLYLVKKFTDRIEFLNDCRTVKITKFAHLSPFNEVPNSQNTLEVIPQKENDLIVLKLHGDLTIETCAALKEAFRLCDPEVKKIIIDCENLSYVDSSGIGIFLEIKENTAKCNTALKICSLNEKINYLFDTTRLNSIFTICSDLISAKNNF
jgi:serine/threonine-protein kinase RsbW